MKYSIILLVFYLTSFQLAGQLRFDNECAKLKTKNEGTPAAPDGGPVKSICEWGTTAFQRCLCEVEKHNKKLYEASNKATIARNAIFKRNKEKYNRANELSSEAYKLTVKMRDINNGDYEKDYYHRTETTLTASYTDWPGIFSGYKSRAIGYVNSAVQTLQRTESTYNLCVAINMGIASDCSKEMPYQDRLNELKNQRQELYDMVYSPPEVIDIKLPSDDDDNLKNVRGNGSVIDSDYEAKHIDRSFSYELDLLKRNAKYLASEEKEMLNRSDLTLEQKQELIQHYTQQKINNANEQRRQYQKDQYENRPLGQVKPSYTVLSGTDTANNSSQSYSSSSYNSSANQQANYAALAQASGQLLDAIFTKDPEAQERRMKMAMAKDKKWRTKISESLNERKQAAEEYNAEANRFIIKQKGLLFGVYDKQANIWKIKPKYRDIKPFKIKGDIHIYKVTTKNLATKKIKIE